MNVTKTHVRKSLSFLLVLVMITGLLCPAALAVNDGDSQDENNVFDIDNTYDSDREDEPEGDTESEPEDEDGFDNETEDEDVSKDETGDVDASEEEIEEDIEEEIDIEEDVDIEDEVSPLAAANYVASSAWDGTTVDFSWYDASLTELHISTPDQWASLSWIVNGKIEEFESYSASLGIAYHGDIPETTDNFEGKIIYLDADLDMGGDSGAMYMPIGSRNAGVWYGDDKNSGYQAAANMGFNGSVDGKGHKIYNLYADYSTNGGYIGLFGGFTGGDITIRNLWIEGSFTGKNCMGGLVADGRNATSLTIENCVNEVALTGTGGATFNTGQGMGGLIGFAFGVTIRNCANLAPITSTSGKFTAGLVGESAGAYVYNSYSNGKITVPTAGTGGAALLCNGTNGDRYTGQLINCYYDGSNVSVWGTTADNTSYATGCFRITSLQTLAASLNGTSTRMWVYEGGQVIPRVFSTSTDTAQVTGVTMTAGPTKLDYIEGQVFDPAGMALTASYSDGTYDTLDGYKISKTEPFTEADAEAGKVTVTVSGSFSGFDYSYDLEVNVTARELTSISADTIKFKFRYYEGDALDLSGAVITATYSDSTAKVTLSPDEYTTSMANGTILTAADHGTKIVVSYTYRGVTKTVLLTGLQMYSIENRPQQDENGTYLISNADELDWFAAHVNTYYDMYANAKLTADIVANSGFNGITYDYYGTFDGDGHSLTVNLSGNVHGLFSYLYGTVQNLTLNGSITSTVNGVGGIAGYTWDNDNSSGAMIINCVNNATVSGLYNVGGIVGDVHRNGADSAIINCVNNGSVTATDSSLLYGVGGIAGALNGTVSGCVNTGAVQSSGLCAGGIAGVGNGSAAMVSNCYNIGTVTTTNASYMGGIMGRNSNSGVVVTNCYNAGSLKQGSTTAGGGIIGTLYYGSNSFTNNYYLEGTANSDAVGSKVTVEELKALAGTLGDAWAADADNVNNGYPVLVWQVSEDNNDGPIPIQDSEGNYLLKTAEHLEWFRTNHNGASAKLVADIEAASDFKGISYYENGTFDGQGHTVTLSGTTGLFTTVRKGAVIRNVTVKGTVSSTGNYIAGLVGEVYSGEVWIENCVNYADVTANKFVGGIVGGQDLYSTVTIRDCENHGAISSTSVKETWGNRPYSGYAGGIAGYLDAQNDSTTLVSGCFNDGAVSGVGGRGIGGIVGGAEAWGDWFGEYIVIENCYNTGSLTDGIGLDEGGNLGGILGEGSSGMTLINCYNTGSLNITDPDCATYPGGIAGTSGNGAFVNCYYLDAIAASGEGGWSVFNAAGVTKVSAETLKSAEMLAKLNTNGLVFLADTDGVNNGYPILAWQSGSLPTLESVTYSGEPQTQYAVGAPVSLGDLVVIANYSGGYTVQLSDYTVSPEVIAEDTTEIVISGSCDGQTYTFRFAVDKAEEPTLDADGYYLLASAADLDWFAKLVNENPYYEDGDNTKHVNIWNAKLVKDIDASKSSALPIGSTLYGYNGTFDGNGHTITVNLNSADSGVALFAQVGLNNSSETVPVIIKNLTVNGSVTCGSSTAAGILAANYGKSTTIENCVNNAEINAVYGYTGGIVGRCGHSGTPVTIINCVNNGDVLVDIANNGSGIGGIGGYAIYGTLEGCVNNGVITGGMSVGGIAGACYANVSDCYNTGSVTGNSYYVGGIAGRSDGTVTNCFNTGDITAANQMGGVVGYNYKGDVNGCYNTGNVSGTGTTYFGGVIGINYANVTNCYNTGSVSGAGTGARVGGIVGQQNAAGAITTCYNIGAVSGTYAGSILGVCNSAGVTIDNSLCISGQKQSGGYVGNAPTLIGYTNAADETMKSATVVGILGDAYVRDIYDLNGGYPILAWQVADMPDLTVTITAQPEPFTCTVGGEAQALTVAASAAEGVELSYQWYSNTELSTVGATLIEGATQASYTPDVSTVGRLYYWCAVTATQDGYSNSINSSGALVTVETANTPVLDEDGFYPLATADDLNWFADKVANGENTINAKLTADITADASFTGFQQSTDATAFAGIFDGDGHSITVNLTGSHGLFYFMAGTVKDLTVNGSVSGTNAIGGVAGSVRGNGQIINCVNNAAVTGTSSNVGGIVGSLGSTGNTTPQVRDCVNNADVTGLYGVGGVVGYSSWSCSAVYDCVNHGAINATRTTSSSYGVGGVTGYFTGTVSGCVNTGAVSAVADLPVGGVIGYSSLKVVDCYNTGTVTSTAVVTGTSSGVGGVVGRAGSADTIVANCYNIGTVNASGYTKGAGGVIGRETAGSVNLSNLYYLDGSVNGTVIETTGAAISAGELKALASTLGEAWSADTDNINNGYPILAWQGGEKPAPEPDTIEIEISANNSGAVIVAPEGGWVEGENTFTVSNDLACVVAVSYDGGVTYTRLSATANDDGTYSFTAGLTEGATIAVAVKGDTTGDGELSIEDVFQLVNMASEGNYDDTLSKLVGDINVDGDLSIEDVFQLTNAVSGIGLTW